MTDPLTPDEAVSIKTVSFEHVVVGNLKGSYTFRDDKLIFHFYKMDRLSRWDVATSIPDCEDIPWWAETEQVLRQVFAQEFPVLARIDFNPEVDSWSAILSGVLIPGVRAKEHLESVIHRIADRLQG